MGVVCARVEVSNQKNIDRPKNHRPLPEIRLHCHDPPLGESDEVLWCNRDAELTEKIRNLADFKGLRCIDGCENPAAVGNSYNPAQLFLCSKDLRKICLREFWRPVARKPRRLLDIFRCRIRMTNTQNTWPGWEDSAGWAHTRTAEQSFRADWVIAAGLPDRIYTVR